ncbi:hypothetical protein CLF_100148 [Clonorchis sinensis]|uniref:Uncharacterized protein n=1 Tax=Clonorchis sinensis TaxID=79923 RepID=G7Y2S6_CLOSI|nr:hypothetical protein CLF_100148 [Clonorchis sinensis]
MLSLMSLSSLARQRLFTKIIKRHDDKMTVKHTRDSKVRSGNLNTSRLLPTLSRTIFQHFIPNTHQLKQFKLLTTVRNFQSSFTFIGFRNCSTFSHTVILGASGHLRLLPVSTVINCDSYSAIRLTNAAKQCPECFSSLRQIHLFENQLTFMGDLSESIVYEILQQKVLHKDHLMFQLVRYSRYRKTGRGLSKSFQQPCE